MLKSKLIKKGLRAMLAIMKSSGLAPEVNVRITQVTKLTREGFTLPLKARANVTTNSKYRYLWPPKKGLNALQFSNIMLACWWQHKNTFGYEKKYAEILHK